MKIGIFGGSFNPVHNMHCDIANCLIENNYLDQVFFIPVGNKYSYKNNLEKDYHRYNMLKLVIDNDKTNVSDFELKKEVVYTYETLAYFKEVYPNDEIYFICGLDNLEYIDKWKNGKDIIDTYKILAIKRSGYDYKELLNKYDNKSNIIIVDDISIKDLSSTMIRNKIANDIDVSEYINKDVYEYIKKYNLYK